MKATTIPVFPLGVVLLPGLPLPLHIFEDRYKEMVTRCLDEDIEFGVLYYDGSKLRSHGCSARIEQVVKTYDDGRMDIVALGTTRFRVTRMDDSLPYMQADVELFDDYDSDSDVADALRQTAVEKLRAFVEVSDRRIDVASLSELDASALSFLIAGTEAFESHEQQRLLEIDSTKERLDRCIAALEDTLERLRLNRQIKQIIGTNGHIPDAFGDDENVELP